MKTTRLSKKMRALAGTAEAHAPALNMWADRLDRTLSSLGREAAYGSKAYAFSRRLFCQVSGQGYDEKAGIDLQLVDR